jgi:YjbE family integral membrane protein
LRRVILAAGSWRHAITAQLTAELTALFSVIVIDLVLAGDNAVVVGLAAAGLPQDLRRRAILIGIAAAALLRIVFAVFATQLLNVIGLVLAGGLLLLWVAWKLFRETRRHMREAHEDGHVSSSELAYETPAPAPRSVSAAAVAATPAPKTFRSALTQIIIADVSMSLDNVLAVAGTARDHVWVMVVGLALSVALMGVAATMIAGMLRRYPWISYVGLALIAWVAVTMIYEGGEQLLHVAREARMF